MVSIVFPVINSIDVAKGLLMLCLFCIPFSCFSQPDSLIFLPDGVSGKWLHRAEGSRFAQNESSIGFVSELEGFQQLYLGFGIAKGSFNHGEGGGNATVFGASMAYNPMEQYWAPKLNAQYHAYFLFVGYQIGLNSIVYYKDGNANFVVRPEIGLGLIKVYLNYGYNFFRNANAVGIPKHTFRLSYYYTFFPPKDKG